MTSQSTFTRHETPTKQVRIIGRCKVKGCACAIAYPVTIRGYEKQHYYLGQPDYKYLVWDYPQTIELYCRIHKRRIVNEIVSGKFSEVHVCDARCRNAKGGNCDCSCAGANHGIGYVPRMLICLV